MSYNERPKYSEMSREDLIERIRQLEEGAGLTFVADPKLGLTPNENMIVGAFINAGTNVLTRARLMDLLYGTRPNPPEEKIIDVYLTRLRDKLGRYNIKFVNSRAAGWFLDREDHARLTEVSKRRVTS